MTESTATSRSVGARVLRRTAFAAAAAFLTGLAAGCGGDTAPAPPVAPAPAPPPAAPAPCSEACATDGRVLNYGFYSDFDPLSYSETREPGSAGFDEHRGYEADLVTALEAMDGAALEFSRSAIAVWPDIWLLPATPDYDLVGGGITILESRTRNAEGETVVQFTSGHVTFRQSLLVRAADATRLASYADLDREDTVGVLSGTTGEARLLQLVGLADENGVLAAGARITTGSGAELVSDGTAAFTISSARVSENLLDRASLYPPSEDQPQVLFHPGDASVETMLGALRDGTTDAFARGEIGNRDAAALSGGAFVVTALDEAAEFGGFVFAAEDTDLHACVDEKVNYLTDDRNLGYADWRANPQVFLERATAWVCGG